MRKIIYKKWLDVIADYYSGDYPDKDKALKMAIANAVASIPFPWKDSSDALTENMVYWGAVESVKGGCYGITYQDAFNDMKKVYNGEFNEDAYINKGGDWRYKNDKPYVWAVYCTQIARALATYFNKEYADKGIPFTVGDID